MIQRNRLLTLVLLLGVTSLVHAAELAPRIAWYGTLQTGLAEAKRSGRPILLVSGAPACLGVPGIW